VLTCQTDRAKQLEIHASAPAEFMMLLLLLCPVLVGSSMQASCTHDCELAGTGHPGHCSVANFAVACRRQ
jgi:hypothetical protein